MNERNLIRLLAVTLQRARNMLPGAPGYVFTEESMSSMTDIERRGAELGMDVDEVLALEELEELLP